ncbi:MAG: LysM peptidoglycan-binding domain-containing protein [bacterium]|nr:LysM peptidoglycan-binding domain-containing protein [bacterium]
MSQPIVDEKFLNNRIVKAFRHLTLTDLPDAPVHALRGLSEGDGELLYKSFYVKTIRDMADLKYIMWAQEIVALGKVPQAKIDMHAFKDKLIKKYEATPIKKLIQSPITVLQGVSAADTKRMREAFNVKTVNDLARLKFARWSQEICGAAYESMSAPIAQPASLADESTGAAGLAAGDNQIGESRGQTWLRTLLLILLVAAILFALYYFFRNCRGDSDRPQGQDAAQIEQVDAAKQIEQSGQDDENQANNADGATGESGADENASPNNDANGSVQPANSENTDTSGAAADSTVAPGERIQPGTNYAVRRGDTLYDLSRRAYGSQRQWRKIFEANRGLISDPDLLVTGRSLKIP